MSFGEIKRFEHSNGINSRVWSITWNHTGKILASCGDDRTVKIWKLIDNDNCYEFERISVISGDHSRAIRSVSFSPCGKYLAVASFDASIIVYTFANGDFEEIHKLEGHENEVKCCVYSSSGRFLSTASRDKSVWDFDVCSILQSHTADVKFVNWHPNDDILVSGGYDCSLRFYCFDGSDFVTIQKVEMAHDNTCWWAAFDPSGKYVCSVGADGFIKIWKEKESSSLLERSWLKISEIEIDTRWPIYTMDWSHLGYIAIAGGDKKIRIFNFDIESESPVFIGSFSLNDEINSIRWNPSIPNLLAAACDDGFVYYLNFVP